MTNKAPWLDLLREGAFFLVLAAFLCRALMPVGFMPEFSKASGSFLGGMQMVICSGYMEKTINVTADHDPVAPHEQTVKKDTCPFAANSGGALPTPILALLPVLLSPANVTIVINDAVTAPHPAQPYPSRAPPAFNA